MKNGYVYVLEFENEVKIGRTINPTQRISCISTSKGEFPKRTFVSEKCSNYYKIETELHKKFKEQRNIGEYFKSNFDEVVLQLKNMTLTKHSEAEIEEADKLAYKRIKEIVNNMFDYEIEKIEDEKKLHCNHCCIPLYLWNDFAHSENCSTDDECKIYSDYYDIQCDLENGNVKAEQFILNVYEMLDNFDLNSKDLMCEELIFSSFDLGIIDEQTYNELTALVKADNCYFSN